MKSMTTRPKRQPNYRQALVVFHGDGTTAVRPVKEVTSGAIRVGAVCVFDLPGFKGQPATILKLSNDTTRLFEWERAFIPQTTFPPDNIEGCFGEISELMRRPQDVTDVEVEVEEPPAKKPRSGGTHNMPPKAKPARIKKLPPKTGIESVCGGMSRDFYKVPEKAVKHSKLLAIFPVGDPYMDRPLVDTTTTTTRPLAKLPGDDTHSTTRPLAELPGDATLSTTRPLAELPGDATLSTTRPGDDTAHGSANTARRRGGAHRHLDFLAGDQKDGLDDLTVPSFLADLLEDTHLPPPDPRIDLLLSMVKEQAVMHAQTTQALTQALMAVQGELQELRQELQLRLPPATPAPFTLAPFTLPPAPATPGPVTLAPLTPAPVITAPLTPAPVITAPPTPAPVNTATYTPAPYTPGPVATTPVAPSQNTTTQFPLFQRTSLPTGEPTEAGLVPEEQLREQFRKATSDKNFAALLMRYMFSEEERFREGVCVSGWAGTIPLSPTGKRVQYINTEVQKHFYIDPALDRKRQGKLRRAMDDANRRDKVQFMKKNSL